MGANPSYELDYVLAPLFLLFDLRSDFPLPSHISSLNESVNRRLQAIQDRGGGFPVLFFVNALRLVKETDTPFCEIQRGFGNENPSIVFAEFSPNSRYYMK